MKNSKLEETFCKKKYFLFLQCTFQQEKLRKKNKKIKFFKNHFTWKKNSLAQKVEK